MLKLKILQKKSFFDPLLYKVNKNTKTFIKMAILIFCTICLSLVYLQFYLVRTICLLYGLSTLINPYNLSTSNQGTPYNLSPYGFSKANQSKKVVRTICLPYNLSADLPCPRPIITAAECFDELNSIFFPVLWSSLFKCPHLFWAGKIRKLSKILKVSP